MAISKDFSNELEKAVQTAKKYTAEMLKQPGIVIVGAGIKRRKGKSTGEAAIIVTVKEKLTQSKLEERGWKSIPKKLDGVPVDVVEYQKPAMSKREEEKLKKAVAIKQEVEKEWLSRKNITGIGVGYKIQDNQYTDQICIRIYVENKLSVEDLKKQEIKEVPEKIKGIPTDVIEMKPVKYSEGASGSRDDRFDPLIGGISTGLGSKNFSYGTLAGIAFDSGNNPVVLSNEHVWDGNVGDNVVQPGLLGVNGFEFSFQLDVCNPLNFFRLDTPSTVGGSILAGAAAAAALAAGLSDEIDPTREGQKATIPPDGALTKEEYTDVKFKFPEFPIPGTPFHMDVDWKYERRTTAGTFLHSDSPSRKNPHYLMFHKLLTDRTLYNPDDIIRLYGLVIHSPEAVKRKRASCDQYYCVAHLYPKRMDKDYPIVLRPWKSLVQGNPNGPDDDKELISGHWMPHDKLSSAFATSTHGYSGLQDQLTGEELELIKKHRRDLCIYYGEIPAKDLPTGPWGKWMFVQTVNDVVPGTDKLIAAQTIGGLPASQNFTSTLDVACGPFVFEDEGSFDIELFSI